MIIEKQNWNYLVEEVRHWIEDVDDPTTTDILESGDMEELADHIAATISNYNSLEDFGYPDTMQGDEQMFKDVKYILTEGLYRGWDYVRA